MIKLGTFYETYGQLNRKIHFFFANDVVKLDQIIDSGDYVPEDIEVVLVDFGQAVNMALKNEIVAQYSSGSVITFVLCYALCTPFRYCLKFDF